MDAQDDQWDQCRVWQDKDSDGDDRRRRTGITGDDI